MGEMTVRFQYPYSNEFEFDTHLERINLDEERKNDIITANGFIVTSHKSIKKDIKDPRGIFSPAFGQTLQDVHPFADRFKCDCGHVMGRLYFGTTCPVCHTMCKYVDDNFNYFGWITIKDPYYIIHPNLFKSISSLIGQKRFMRIITRVDEKDADGHSIDFEKPKDEPFYGIGMMGFKENFLEIIRYYYRNTASKQDTFIDILENQDKVFTQSIPVYTTHLRPFKIEGSSLFYEDTNAMYTMMTKLAAQINNDTIKVFKKDKPKNQLLLDLQLKYNDLYKELEATMSGKKGSIRALFSGRMNFSARNVIVLDTSLRIDQIKLSYRALLVLLEQSIINILHKSYNMNYADAYKTWLYGTIRHEPYDILLNIINSIINNYPEGIPVLINRNPTINYGSIVQMFCIGINDNYTMSIPYGVLAGLAADFDGDTLNILYMINKEFIQMTNLTLNPRNAMYLSKNDGYLNTGVLPMRDTLVNANTLINLCRSNYTPEQLAKIEAVKNKRIKEVV